MSVSDPATAPRPAGPAAAPPGYISDYITGEHVRATPEEVEAVQVLAKRLVEGYGYPHAHIRTHPQFRVRKRPSDRPPFVGPTAMRVGLSPPRVVWSG